MRYEFQVIQTVVIDSEHLANVDSEEKARELLANGWGVKVGEAKTELVHVGHGKACIHAYVYESPDYENLRCLDCEAEVENDDDEDDEY